VTRWGLFLLVLFFVLGLTGTKQSKALTLCISVTAIVLTATMATYVR